MNYPSSRTRAGSSVVWKPGYNAVVDSLVAQRGIRQLDRVSVCRSLLPLLGHLAPIRQQYVHDTLFTNLKGQIIAYNYRIS